MKQVHFAHWNVNGWTDSNHSLRETILQSLDADIISLNETHLWGEGIIDIEGYMWFGNNRITLKSTKSIRWSGDSCEIIFIF